MKRILLIVALAIFPSIADAGWQYVPYQNGYYTFSDGFTNNGRYYVQSVTPGYWYCGCWYPGVTTWKDAGPIGGASDTYSVSSGGYGESYTINRKNWKTDFPKILAELKDTELMRATIADAGLHINNPVAGSSYASYGLYGSSGLTTLTQGYASQGSTGYGLAAGPAVSAGVSRDSTRLMIHEYQRGADTMVGASTQIHTNLADLIGQSIAADSDDATALAVGNAVSSAILAKHSKTETRQWEKHPVQSVQPQPSDPAPDLPTPPNVPQSSAPRSSQALTIVSGYAKYQSNHCADCHDGKGKDAPNFSESVLATMNPEDRHGLAKRAMDRMKGESPGKPRMPKGHPAASESDAKDIAVYFYGN